MNCLKTADSHYKAGHEFLKLMSPKPRVERKRISFSYGQWVKEFSMAKDATT